MMIANYSSKGKKIKMIANKGMQERCMVVVPNGGERERSSPQSMVN